MVALHMSRCATFLAYYSATAVMNDGTIRDTSDMQTYPIGATRHISLTQSSFLVHNPMKRASQGVTNSAHRSSGNALFGFLGRSKAPQRCARNGRKYSSGIYAPFTVWGDGHSNCVVLTANVLGPWIQALQPYRTANTEHGIDRPMMTVVSHSPIMQSSTTSWTDFTLDFSAIVFA